MSFEFHPAITLALSTIQFILWFVAAVMILPERFSRKTTVLGVAISLVVFYLISLLPLFSAIRILAGLVVVGLAIQLLFRGKWYQKLLVAAVILLTMMLSEALMIPFVPRDVTAHDLALTHQLMLNLIYLFLHVSLLAAIVLFYRQLKKHSQGESGKGWYLFFLLFPISQYFAFSGWFIPTPPYMNVSGPFAFVSILLFLAADIGLAFAMFAVSRAAVLRTQNELLQTQVAAEQDHYAALAANYEDIRRLRHDIDNHLYSMKALLADGRSEEAAQYAEEVYEARQEASRSLPGCENTVVSSFVLHKQQELSERGISLKLNVILPKLTGITDLDLICALGNLLDNAAEACAEIPDAEVNLELRCVAPYLHMRVTNPCFPEGKEKPQRFAGLSRGVGQEILSRLAERYDGHYEYEQKNGQYDARLFLKMNVPLQGEISIC